jgi:hypothetical protein
MGQYRISRNCEGSIINWLEIKLEEDFWSVRVEKAFSKIYDGTLPAMAVMVGPTTITRREIGGKTFLKVPEISIRIFATSDGQRLDLKDWLIDELENDIDYFTYSIEDGQAEQKLLAGKISIRQILRDDKELSNIENLNKVDKFRHIITFSAHVALT